MNCWLLSGNEEETFNKHLKFPIKLFVFFSFDVRLAVSQELMVLREGDTMVVMQLLREDRQKGNVSFPNLPLVHGFHNV